MDLHTAAEAARWLQQRVHGQLRADSRQVQPGDGFIAWPGAAHDARAHVPAALAQGASACLVERTGAAEALLANDRVASFGGLKEAAAAIAARFHGDPSHALRMLAVTGTNGKTSTAWWLAQALSSTALTRPLPCAVVGTLGIGRPPATAALHCSASTALSAPAQPDAHGAHSNATADAVATVAPAQPADRTDSGLIATGLTTPDPVLLQHSLRGFVAAGLQACAIEASSIGIAEHRLDALRIHTAIFTNFTQDHLDYHGSMEAYWQAKQRLFHWPRLQAAVVNIDDPQGSTLAQSLEAGALDLWTVSCRGAARLAATNLTVTDHGLAFEVREGAQRHRLATALIGHYNVANLLGVIAAMRTLGVPLAEAVAACATLTPVPGRMEQLHAPGMPWVAVDYAHTPDALAQALAALRPLAQQRAGQLWCVFGCGGNRDPGKRPLMGSAARAADHVVVTSDNPRMEDPQAIIAQIAPALDGHPSVHYQPDRAAAIALALQDAAVADVVLLAGKGHEDYQDAAGQRRPFSDLAQARAALAQRARQSHAAGAGA